MIKVAFLGVATTPAPESLAAQLKLPAETGLLVEFVEEGSPAAKAGIKRNDVLIRLNDQILVNPPQLAALVRMQKPKDKVTLVLVREGKQEKVTAELAEREMPAEPPRPEGVGVPGQIFIFPGPHDRNLEEMQEMMNRMRRDMGERHQRFGMPPPPGGGAAVSASMSYSDGEHTLNVRECDGERFLVATGRDGRVIFEGPINTPEQRDRVPPEIRRKLEKMEQTTRREMRSEMTVSDGEHTFTQITENWGRRLIVKNRDGKVIFEGPINTEEQMRAVPEPFRQKVRELFRGGPEGPRRPDRESPVRGTPL